MARSIWMNIKIITSSACMARSIEIFWFLDPQNHSESLQTVFRWILGLIPDIFCNFEKIDFFTILARRGPQNVQKSPKMAQNGHFGHFGPFLAILGHFLGPVGPKWWENRIFHKSKKCRENYPETIQKRFGTITNGFGGQKIETPTVNIFGLIHLPVCIKEMFLHLAIRVLKICCCI